jgi:hypothetical protein
VTSGRTIRVIGQSIIEPLERQRVIPSTREGAQRLGVVTLTQMIRALLRAVENPPRGVRVVEVPAIRSAILLHHGGTEGEKRLPWIVHPGGAGLQGATFEIWASALEVSKAGGG